MRGQGLTAIVDGREIPVSDHDALTEALSRLGATVSKLKASVARLTEATGVEDEWLYDEETP